MATERRPWPNWATDSYMLLRAYSHNAVELADEAIKIQHRNVYRMQSIFLQLRSIGYKLTIVAKEAKKVKKEDDQQWPKWAAAAVETAWDSGIMIKSGAKHGLGGLNLDGQGENWAQVLKGLNTCIEHAHKVEIALTGGPPPEVNILDELSRTLDMGEQTETPTGNKWRRNTR